jgi:hypothetical protein
MKPCVPSALLRSAHEFDPVAEPLYKLKVTNCRWDGCSLCHVLLDQCYKKVTKILHFGTTCRYHSQCLHVICNTVNAYSVNLVRLSEADLMFISPWFDVMELIIDIFSTLDIMVIPPWYDVLELINDISSTARCNGYRSIIDIQGLVCEIFIHQIKVTLKFW